VFRFDGGRAERRPEPGFDAMGGQLIVLHLDDPLAPQAGAAPAPSGAASASGRARHSLKLHRARARVFCATEGNAGEDLTMRGKRRLWAAVLLLSPVLSLALVAGAPASFASTPGSSGCRAVPRPNGPPGAALRALSPMTTSMPSGTTAAIAAGVLMSERPHLPHPAAAESCRHAPAARPAYGASFSQRPRLRGRLA
jgi:hypothetical protein